MKRRNEFHIARITFHWPLVYSYRIQHVQSERYEGYYFPPLQQPELPVKENDVDHAGEDSDEDTENVNDAKKAEEETDEVIDLNQQTEEEENDNKLDRADRPWFCIFRAIKSSEETMEGESRKRGRSEGDDKNLVEDQKNDKNDDSLMEKDFKLMKR